MKNKFPTLHLPPIAADYLKEDKGLPQIFDLVRKKWLVLTPEEWVRQHLIQYLHVVLHYPLSLALSEKSLNYNRLKKRCDILWYGNHGKPLLLAECKAPEVKLTQDTMDQAARYNKVIQAPILCISNGIKHYCCLIDNRKMAYLKEIPDYTAAMKMIKNST